MKTNIMSNAVIGMCLMVIVFASSEAKPLPEVSDEATPIESPLFETKLGKSDGDNTLGFPGKTPSEQFVSDQEHLGQLGGVKQEESSVVPYKSNNDDIFWLWTNWPGLNMITKVPGWTQFQQQASAQTSSYSGPIQTVIQQMGLGTFVDPAISNPFKEMLDPERNPVIARLPNIGDIPLILIYGKRDNSEAQNKL